MSDKPETSDPIESTLERVQTALDQGNLDQAAAFLVELHPADQAELFEELADTDQDRLLSQLEIPAAADLLEELEDEDIIDVVDVLPADRLADVLDEMEPDEAADLLGDLPADQVSQVLAQMEDADEVLPLLGYADETAGGLMTTWFVALRQQTTVEQAIDFLRSVSPDTDVPYYLYVIDRNRHLCGIVGLRQLVVSKPETRIQDIASEEVIHVFAGEDQEDVAQLMDRYSLSVVPVVDHEQRLIGVITHDDILDVIQEEATEDIYALASVSDADLEPDSPVMDQIKGRLPWMYLNMGTALFASWVVSHFESLITEVAILAAFQSVVAGLGGNSGSQNVAMVVRSIALGKTEPKAVWRLLARQIMVGALQGIAVGAVVGIGVALWRGNAHLGLILFMAMVANMIIAGIIGTLVPLVLKHFKQDPALASTVLVTAATDSFGFFIFLSLATIFLSNLK